MRTASARDPHRASTFTETSPTTASVQFLEEIRQRDTETGHDGFAVERIPFLDHTGGAGEPMHLDESAVGIDHPDEARASGEILGHRLPRTSSYSSPSGICSSSAAVTSFSGAIWPRLMRASTRYARRLEWDNTAQPPEYRVANASRDRFPASRVARTRIRIGKSP